MNEASETGGLALRLERWIVENADPIKGALQPGVPVARLDDLEKTMHCRLPETVRRFYLQCDGQKTGFGGVFNGEELLSTEGILAQWRCWVDVMKDEMMKDLLSAPDAGVKSDWWNAKWIPLTYDGSGNHYCLDLDPAPGGRVGQIVRMWHDSPERERIAPSFEQWMLDYVVALEAGKYAYSVDAGGIVTKEEAREFER